MPWNDGMRQNRFREILAAGIAAAILAIGAGCEIRRAMFDQPKFESYEATEFFGDRRSARNGVEHTVPRGYLDEDDHLYRGKVGNQFVDEFPFPITEEVLMRGQDRYNIYCAPCHDRVEPFCRIKLFYRVQKGFKKRSEKRRN